MSTQDLMSNLGIVLAELAVIVVAFVVLGWIVRRLIGAVVSAPALKKLAPGAEALGRNIRLLLGLTCLTACIGVAGANGYLLYRGEQLPTYTWALVQDVPREFWTGLAIAMGKIAGLAIVTAFALRLVGRALNALCARAKAFEGVKANDESVEGFFAQLKRIIVRGAWLLLLAISAGLLGLPAVVGQVLTTVVKIYLIAAIGLLCWRGLDAFIASLDALSKKYSRPDNLLRYYTDLAHLMPVFRRTVEAVIYVIVASLIVLQVEAVASLAGWGPRLIRIIGVVFLARLAIEVANLLVQELLVTRAKLSDAAKQRRLTIVPLIRSVLKYAVYFVTAVIVLKELGVDPTPVLAGAGIIGLAVGLGAQNLINDILSGFFVLFEEYYLVGDFIDAAEAKGRVESIEIRSTRIRDNDGRLHIIPNGQIVSIVNYAKQYTRAAVDVGVAYESNLDLVYEVLNDVGRRLHEIDSDVLEPTQVAGLKAFGESELTIRTVTKVKPGRHLQVERDLRKMIKEAFDERGIEIPYARRVLIFQDGLPTAEPTGKAAGLS